MMGQTQDVILVTGSSGLIGSAIINRLADRYRIIGLDRVGPPYPPPVAECVDIDLASDEKVKDAMEHVRKEYGTKIASVIHLAAYYDFSGEPSPLYDEITVQGTRRLIESLQSFQVEQFIFSSSMLVHKSCQPGERINESSPLEAKWAYPESKIKTETLLRAHRASSSLVIARIAGIYNDTCHSIPISHQIKRIYEGELTSHVFPGDPSHGQSFIHLEDTVDALDRLVERRKRLAEELILLLGEPDVMSYQEIQDSIFHLLEKQEGTLYRIPKGVAKLGAILQNILPGVDSFIKPWMISLADDHYALDISHARSLLDWNPNHSLRKSLPKMVEALRKDPVKWYEANNLPTQGIKEQREAVGQNSK